MKRLLNSTVMENGNIGKLLFKLSFPAVIALMVNGLYNLVDSIFVGRGVGADAIGSLAILFPFQMFMAALGGCIGIGTASIISRRLGEKNREAASRTAGTALLLSFISGLLILIIIHIFMDDFLVLFGATEGLILYTKNYLNIILTGNPLLIFSMSASSIARSEGKAIIAMVAMLIGASVNIILDPVFIFVFKLGVRGAALATVLAQFLSFIYMIRFFITGRSSLNIKFSHLKVDWKISQKIFTLGIPALIRQGGTSIAMVILNNSLGKYGGDMYISIYGIIMRTLMFLYMPILGIVQGFQPIAGYNYGANAIERVKKVLKYALISTTLLSLIFFILLYFFAPLFFGFFTHDSEIIRAGIPMLRSIILLLPLLGFQVVSSQFFLSIGKFLPSLILGLSRQVLFLIPLLIILPILHGLDGIKNAFPLADFSAAIITGIWLILELRSYSNNPKIVEENLPAN